MIYRTLKQRRVRAGVAFGESGRRSGLVPPSAALLISVLAVAICLIPLAPANAAGTGGGHRTMAASAQVVNASQLSARSAGVVGVLAGWFGSEDNPIRFPRPRIMAIIGIGLLAVGVLLRRREGNGI
jgi:hypothetical protein